MLIRWNKKHVWSIGSGSQDSSSVTFKPGPNEIKKEDWDKIKDHPEVKSRMEKDVIDEKRGKVKMLEMVVAEKKSSANSPSPDDSSESSESSDSSLSSLSAPKAKELVLETYDIVLLRSWAESESRPKVLPTIKKQIKKIEDERDEENSEE